jgi:guanylate kinase
MAMSENLRRRGFMLIVSSPSGGGKTTIVRSMLKSVDNLKHSISATTRPPRSGEEDLKDYFFLSEEEFKRLRSENHFLEHAKVFKHYYGTPRAYVETQLDASFDVVFDIDWQGTVQLTQNARNDVVSIFVLPPSIGELEQRLKVRNTNSPEEIEYRMQRAKHEISHWYGYDYVIVNSTLEASIDKVKTIIEAERVKRLRQQGLPEFVENLFSAYTD